VISSRHEEVELLDDAAFYSWIAERNPRSRYSVDPDPWTMSPNR
jgi:hypothetical protein